MLGSDMLQEGWLPTFSHTLFVATRNESSGGEGQSFGKTLAALESVTIDY